MREHITAMKPTAVIPLMYESWEVRKSDVDLTACRERGIKFAGTNEHNSLLDVFSFIGPLVVKALHNAFIPLIGSRIVVVSNNAFGLSVAEHLLRNRADVFCVGPKEVFSGGRCYFMRRFKGGRDYFRRRCLRGCNDTVCFK